MANPFDQFDTQAPTQGGGNPFDQFDPKKEDTSSFGGETYKAAANALSAMNAGLNPWSAERKKLISDAGSQSFIDPSSMLESGKLLGRGLTAPLELLASPVTGAARYYGGHGLQHLDEAMRAGAVKLHGSEEGVPPAKTYEESANTAEALLGGMGPKGGMRPVPTALPAPPAGGPLGVTLSTGQETGALPAIRSEQSALAGRIGPTAEAAAKAFQDQQRGQLGTAQERISQGFDPFGQTVAEGPQEAGQLVSQGIQQTAAARKADVDAAYKLARSLPGEVHADVFKDMGTRIKNDLSNRPEPIVIDDSLTPFANKAIEDVDKRISQLQIQNKASPHGQPPQNTIMGVTLDGVDQMRKRLSAFRQQAFGSGNATDGRAVKSVLDAFDDQIDHAINSGLFTGDQRAIQAWNNARAAHADYRSTFSARKGDPVGRVIEKIIGKDTNDPMIPNKVADQLYGAQGTSASDVNVGVANRAKKILGDQSPEWSGVKQGLFSRLTETPEGVTDWGSQKISNNLNNFLNGKGRELAEAIYSPQERQLLQQYADLHKQLVVPPTGANLSQTSTFVNPLLRKIGSKIGTVIGTGVGAMLGHSTGIPYGIEAGAAVGAGVAKAGNALANAREARAISRQMPLVATAMKQYQKQLAAAQRANAGPSNPAVAIAATNLTNALRPLGIDLGTIPAAAQDQKQSGANQPNGGVNGNPNGFARGGHVHKGPPIPGARKAKDGEWYVKDHTRPGKFLRVVT